MLAISYRTWTASSPCNLSMSPVRQYRYGKKPRVLAVIAVVSMAGGFFVFTTGVLARAQLFVLVNQLPDWVAKTIFFSIAITLVGVSLGNTYLLLRSLSAPQFVETSDSELRIPKSAWSSQKQVIPLIAIKKAIGPRSGRLEVRAGHSYFLDRAHFESDSEFIECCQFLFDKLGITRNLSVASNKPPKYRQIAEKFAAGHLSEYYGAVIVSADAFFLVRLKNHPARYKLMAEGIADAIKQFSSKVEVEINLSGLPEAILDDQDWPLWEREGTVLVVPKTAIQSLKMPWWGALTIKSCGGRYVVYVPFWKQKGVRRYLREYGWSV